VLAVAANVLETPSTRARLSLSPSIALMTLMKKNPLASVRGLLKTDVLLVVLVYQRSRRSINPEESLGPIGLTVQKPNRS
jgi:hypothetical protein